MCLMLGFLEIHACCISASCGSFLDDFLVRAARARSARIVDIGAQRPIFTLFETQNQILKFCFII